jgi:SAM-dependent methyltransferase
MPFSEFQDVDLADDPDSQVAYLDTLSGLEEIRAYKRRSHEALRIRPGSRVLDVGCGAGEDLGELAALVGREGRVVGVDSSQTMIAQALERTRGLPVQCQVGDAHALAFPDEAFDGSRADRVLQHVADPARVLAELVRVTRRGGRVAVFEPDWDTLVVSGGSQVVSAEDRALIRAILDFRSDSIRHGWIGRQLAGMAADEGLADVTIAPVAVVVTDLELADTLLELSAAAEGAVAAGVVHHDPALRWLAGLRSSAADGRFMASLTGFLVSGRRP